MIICVYMLVTCECVFVCDCLCMCVCVCVCVFREQYMLGSSFEAQCVYPVAPSPPPPTTEPVVTQDLGSQIIGIGNYVNDFGFILSLKCIPFFLTPKLSQFQGFSIPDPVRKFRLSPQPTNSNPQS